MPIFTPPTFSFSIFAAVACVSIFLEFSESFDCVQLRSAFVHGMQEIAGVSSRAFLICQPKIAVFSVEASGSRLVAVIAVIAVITVITVITVIAVIAVISFGLRQWWKILRLNELSILRHPR